jgi:hypothetical protein
MTLLWPLTGDAQTMADSRSPKNHSSRTRLPCWPVPGTPRWLNRLAVSQSQVVYHKGSPRGTLTNTIFQQYAASTGFPRCQHGAKRGMTMRPPCLVGLPECQHVNKETTFSAILASCARLKPLLLLDGPAAARCASGRTLAQDNWRLP